MKTQLGPRQKKAKQKELDGLYGQYMSGVQVNIMNLSKVSAHVFKAVVEEGKTVEEAYQEAKDLYREN